jgi:hypothetical protein
LYVVSQQVLQRFSVSTFELLPVVTDCSLAIPQNPEKSVTS